MADNLERLAEDEASLELAGDSCKGETSCITSRASTCCCSVDGSIVDGGDGTGDKMSKAGEI